jgi:hypothetical protein
MNNILYTDVWIVIGLLSSMPLTISSTSALALNWILWGLVEMSGSTSVGLVGIFTH